MEPLPLILASSSPRRRQLLTEAGYQFTVMQPSEAVEQAAAATAANIAPQNLVARLAFIKAQDVAGQVPRGIIIGCDTVAECQGQVLGKPADRADARRMLGLLRGQEHRVYSGLCLWRKPDEERRLQIAETKLVMDPIGDADLEQYLDSGQWQGKAGAFGYQDGLEWVHIIEGSESNVVGLPMEMLNEMLANLNSPE
jgi:nucleoside triphosphate pyrophosphatase